MRRNWWAFWRKVLKRLQNFSIQLLVLDDGWSSVVQEKQEKKEIAGLRRRAALAQTASVLLGLFGTGCVCLYFQPALFGISTDPPETAGWLLIWLLAGIGLLCISCFFFTLVTQWTKRLLWIRENVAPSIMKLSLEVDDGSDSTTFYALLVPVAGTRNTGWRMSLWAKPPNLRRFLNKEFSARVYFDPESGRPALVDFDHGILWSMAGSGSTKRIGAE
jgi:hypothetical protein